MPVMGQRRAILLEDDVALRDLLVEALDGEGFDVRACDSFEEIHEAAKRQEADIAIADFWGGSQRTLPDSDREEIRELCSHLPVILLTGRSWAAETSAEELGAQALIRKPFDLDLLLKTVAAAVPEHQS
jgi:two-component system, NtrC family, nitrogen regulation response regulator GlnG